METTYTQEIHGAVVKYPGLKLVRFQVAGEPGGGQDHHEGGGVGWDLEIEFDAGVDQHRGDRHQGGETDAACELATAPAHGEDRVL